MVTEHYQTDPFRRGLFNIDDSEIKGTHFEGWKEKANYSITLQIVLQIDTTNVTDCEKRIAPNITFITTNQAIVNIYKTAVLRGKSKEEFNAEEARLETALQKEVYSLQDNLNACRKQAKLVGEWFVNYSLNDRKIEVSKP